jgi:hypothetical protein
MSETKQFGRVKPEPFMIGNLHLEAAPEVSAKVMLDMANLKAEMSEGTTSEDKINAIAKIFKKILSEGDYKALMDGLRSEKIPGGEGVDPIGIHTLMEVTEWLFGEVYGGRPTQSPQS